ncbi:hypothetical protein H1R20_g1884, partial [Candolleomyces eurysporus]
MPCTLRILFRRWTNQIIPALGEPGSSLPSCHESEAARQLTEGFTISVHHWNYRGPPDSFLDLEWDESLAPTSPFGPLNQKNPCPLTETTIIERIVMPVLMTMKDKFEEIFEITVNGNMLFYRDTKGPSKTAPDITAHKARMEAGGWVRYGPHQAFLEGKGPLSASSPRLNAGLDSFLNKCLDDLEDYDEGSRKLLGQSTLQPHGNDISHAYSSKSLASTLKPIISTVQQSLLSLSFTLLGPIRTFKFLKSFSTSPLQVSSIITLNDWTRFVHANLPPDSVLARDSAVVYIYRRWGFVVKYALDQTSFDAELRAIQGLSLCDRFPSLIAHGSTNTMLRTSSSPFMVITYHGEPVQNFDQATVSNTLYYDVIKPMHEGGWHHHDLKPDNVLLDDAGKLSLIDFNLAVPRDECARLMCPDRAFLRRWRIDT